MFSRYISVNHSQFSSTNLQTVICDWQMKLQTDKACDLRSSSVVPQRSRKSSGFLGRLESPSIPWRSHTAYRCCNNCSSLSRRELCLFSQCLHNPQDKALINEVEGVKAKRSSNHVAASHLLDHG